MSSLPTGERFSVTITPSDLAGPARIGLGCMKLSTAAKRPDEAAAVAVVHAALDAGVRLLDTSDAYVLDHTEPNHNERLLRRALASWSGDTSEVVVATKGGITRPPRGGGRAPAWVPDGRGKHLRAACEASLEALGVERIDLYQLHAVDDRVDLLTSVRALAKLQRDGLVRDIGLCNVRVQDIERARGVADIASVQVALSPFDDSALRGGVADCCLEAGLTLIAHSPFGGQRKASRVGRHPTLKAVAKRHGVSPWTVALAWLVGLSPQIVPIPGASRLESVASAAATRELVLEPEDLAALDEAFPAGRLLRTRRADRAPLDGADGDVVLLMGYPGAGKTTAVEPWLEAGYHRINRDLTGGRLDDLAGALDQALSEGQRRVVLDNTYPRRASRNLIIETAWRHGVPVRCDWLETSLEDAQVNACHRMITRHGRLLSPEEMNGAAKKEPSSFPPRAQLRYRRALEAPRIEEGFVEVRRLPFVRAAPLAEGRAVLVSYEGAVWAGRPTGVDDVSVDADHADRLRGYAAEGWTILGVGWLPGGDSAVLDVTHGQIGVPMEGEVCTHAAGPPRCWCRKPLPGLGVALFRRHGLRPASCLYLGHGSADERFAAQLGVPYVDVGGA